MDYKFVTDFSNIDHKGFVDRAIFADIFQDPSWAEVSGAKGWGKSVDLGMVDENGDILVSAQGYVNSSRFFGNYLYLQHGPIFAERLVKQDDKTPAESWGEVNFTDEQASETARIFLKEVENFAKQQGYYLVIIEPLSTAESDFHKLLLSQKYVQQKWSILPRYPLFIDLTRGDEELMQTMEKNTRYNIRKSQKDGVQIKYHYPTSENKTRTAELIDTLYTLLGESSEMKGYTLPPKSFFLKATEVYEGTGKLLLAYAEYEGKIISINFTQIQNKWAGSYYTANSRDYPKLRASYPLKWETIMEAKRQGVQVFDMWGQIPGLDKSNSEYGYGQFKRSFGPIEKTFSGRLVLPINTLKYTLFRLLASIRYKMSH